MDSRELTRNSLIPTFGDITIVKEGYRVTLQITRKGSDNNATFTVTVPRSGKQARAKRWEKSPEEIQAEALRAVASLGAAISTL